MLLDPSNPLADRRVALFLQSRDPELERWDGYRPAIDSALRKATGIKTIWRTGGLPRSLSIMAGRTKKVACLHGFAAYNQPVSPDLAIFQQMSQRIPGLQIEDQTNLLRRMRSVKSKAEVALMQRAADITAEAYDNVLATLSPGMSEFDVQETLEHTYRSNGSRGPAYGTIAGGGLNGTVLHYQANDQQLADGDLIVIDSGRGVPGLCGRCDAYVSSERQVHAEAARGVRRRAEGASGGDQGGQAGRAFL